VYRSPIALVQLLIRSFERLSQICGQIALIIDSEIKMSRPISDYQRGVKWSSMKNPVTSDPGQNEDAELKKWLSGISD
jgi:hypothetical protein